MAELQVKRILLTGGGSGGHIYPLLSVAQEMEKLAAQYRFVLQLYYMGPRDRYEPVLINNGITVTGIAGAKWRRYASLANLLDIPRFFIGLVQALWKMYWLMPDAIFSKGGTGALPVVLAGAFFRVPIIIHESDSTPGLTNIVSSRFAVRIGLGFDTARQYFRTDRAAVTGNPLREELFKGRLLAKDAKEKLGFDPNEPLILVSGGSQGSQSINTFILTHISQIIKETQVLHQTGFDNFTEVERLSRAALLDVPVQTAAKHRYQAVAFLEKDLTLAYCAADVIVGRAGASTMTEAMAFGKPMILIPHAAGNNHQFLNAQEAARAGAALIIEQNNLLPAVFMRDLLKILKEPGVMEKMSAASAALFRADAARVIAEEVLKVS